jgi:HAD superfamily hydrolase (TIGR01450 family)
VKRYKLYILDLDGTLYRGAEPIPGAVSTVQSLRANGAEIRYLTNNSGQTREFYQQKLSAMGFPVKPSEVYSSAIGAGSVCVERGFGSVFYVGQPGLRQTLLEAGLNVVNEGEIADSSQPASVVVAGICRNLTYQWVNSALQQILQGADFIATNTDATYPIEGGRVEPGAGAVVAAIQTCSGKEPTVIGKPNRLLIDLILADTGIVVQDTLVVGDRYETDILSGINAGCDTHLVLTGVTQTPPAGQSWSPDMTALLIDPGPTQ